MLVAIRHCGRVMRFTKKSCSIAKMPFHEGNARKEGIDTDRSSQTVEFLSSSSTRVLRGPVILPAFDKYSHRYSQKVNQ
jgi:hypothetical protein